MKKLVLIPHERYEQFLSRESKEHSVQPESTEKHLVAETTSMKPQEEAAAEKLVEEKPSNSQDPENLSQPPPLPPPPGQPAISLQTGEGASEKAKRRKESKSHSWRQKWKAY